jgi:hypothetical protein
MLIFNKGKMREILSAPEILRIEPQDIKFSKKLQLIIILIISIGYAMFIYKMIERSNLELLFVTGLFAVIIVAILLLSRKTTPFVITNRGLLKYPYVAEFWEDIESYTWETFTGAKRLPLQPSHSVTTLYLVNKGGILRQRNIENRTGHTVFGNCGIFFTHDQIEATDRIFQEHGIKKIPDRTETTT